MCLYSKVLIIVYRIQKLVINLYYNCNQPINVLRNVIEIFIVIILISGAKVENRQ